MVVDSILGGLLISVTLPSRTTGTMTDQYCLRWLIPSVTITFGHYCLHWPLTSVPTVFNFAFSDYFQWLSSFAALVLVGLQWLLPSLTTVFSIYCLLWFYLQWLSAVTTFSDYCLQWLLLEFLPLPLNSDHWPWPWNDRPGNWKGSIWTFLWSRVIQEPRKRMLLCNEKWVVVSYRSSFWSVERWPLVSTYMSTLCPPMVTKMTAGYSNNVRECPALGLCGNWLSGNTYICI